jgi:hypothetical protein
MADSFVRYCLPRSSTADAAKCKKAITGLSCFDIRALLFLLKQTTNIKDDESLCGVIDSAVNAPEKSEDDKKSLEELSAWYRKTAAPCFSSTCQFTTHPVSEEAIAGFPSSVVMGLVMSKLSPWQLFAVSHPYVVGLGVLLVLVAVFGGCGYFIGKRSKFQ